MWQLQHEPPNFNPRQNFWLYSNLCCIPTFVRLQGGRKVVCGDGEGTLLLYHWGLWGDCTDRYPAHSDSVDSLLAIGDSVLCSGSSDGTVKYVHVHQPLISLLSNLCGILTQCCVIIESIIHNFTKTVVIEQSAMSLQWFCMMYMYLLLSNQDYLSFA